MDFPFSFPCPNCDTKLKIKEASVLGRTIMCPQCGKKMTAEAPEHAGDSAFDFGDELELLKPLPAKRARTKMTNDKPRPIGQEPKKKRKPPSHARSSNPAALLIAVGGIAVLLVSAGIFLWMFGERIATLTRLDPRQSDNPPSILIDPYAAAAQEADAGERPYLLAAKPFLEAIRTRNYAAAYKTLSPHARAAVQPEQFVMPTEDNHVALPLIHEITEEQFLDSMKKMEVVRGIPVKVLHFYVTSADPNVLAGKGEAFESMYAIGGMPKEIPAGIRKASLRAQIQCNYSDEQVKQIARETGASEDQIRSGKMDGEEAEDDPDDKPYLNLKFVLVEEDGQLKVGYFEFMPPSILD